MLSSDTNNPREDSVFLRVKAAVRRGGGGGRPTHNNNNNNNNNNNTNNIIINKISGPSSLVALLRDFRALAEESESEKGISYKYFIQLLRDHGVQLRESEESYLCLAFDDTQSGFISSERFVRHLTGLNARRHKAILRAWETFSGVSNNNNNNNNNNNKYNKSVPLETLIERYTQSGTRADFSSTFNTTTYINNMNNSNNNNNNMTTSSASYYPDDTQEENKNEIKENSQYNPNSTNPNTKIINNQVTLEEFIAYYAAVSAEIAVDEKFELYLLREWNADAPTHPTMHETKREWGPAGDPLEINGPRFVQDALNKSLATSTREYNYTHMKRVHPYIAPLPPLEKDYLSTTKRDFGPIAREEFIIANTLRHR